MTDVTNTSNDNQPTHKVYLRIRNDRQRETKVYIGNGWKHGKGSGINLSISRPGDLVLEAIRNQYCELVIFEDSNDSFSEGA